MNEIQDTVSSAPFALVLLDGDGYIFDERLLQKGVEGGENAAYYLQNYVERHLRSKKTQDVSLDKFKGANNWRIMVKIYLNLEGLARTLTSTGCIAGSNVIRDFAIGLTRSRPLFEVVDVGQGCVIYN